MVSKLKRNYDFKSCPESISDSIAMCQLSNLDKDKTTSSKTTQIESHKEIAPRTSEKETNHSDFVKKLNAFKIWLNKKPAHIIKKALTNYKKYNSKHHIDRKDTDKTPRYYDKIKEFYEIVSDIISVELNSTTFTTNSLRNTIRNLAKVVREKGNYTFEKVYYDDAIISFDENNNKKIKYITKSKFIDELANELLIAIMEYDLRDTPNGISGYFILTPNASSCYTLIRFTIHSYLCDLLKAIENNKKRIPTISLDNYIESNDGEKFILQIEDTRTLVDKVLFLDDNDFSRSYLYTQDAITIFAENIYSSGHIDRLLGFFIGLCEFKPQDIELLIHKNGYKKVFNMLNNYIYDNYCVDLSYIIENIKFRTSLKRKNEITSDNLYKWKHRAIKDASKIVKKYNLQLLSFVNNIAI